MAVWLPTAAGTPRRSASASSRSPYRPVAAEEVRQVVYSDGLHPRRAVPLEHRPLELLVPWVGWIS